MRQVNPTWKSLLVLFCFHLLPLPTEAQQYSDQQIEKARKAVHHFKQQYWDCLAGEQQKMLLRMASTDDFKLYIKGACLKERHNFKVPFIDLLAMKFPQKEATEHSAAFDGIVSETLDAAVAGYISAKIQ